MNAVRKIVTQIGGGLERQAGLADPAGACQRDESHVGAPQPGTAPHECLHRRYAMIAQDTKSGTGQMTQLPELRRLDGVFTNC